MKISKAPLQVLAILFLGIGLVVCTAFSNSTERVATNRQKLESVMKQLRVGMSEDEEAEVLSEVPYKGWARDQGAQSGLAAFQKNDEPGPVLQLTYEGKDGGFRLSGWKLLDLLD